MSGGKGGPLPQDSPFILAPKAFYHDLAQPLYRIYIPPLTIP